ncbi:hypothetical protein BGZ51_002536 [Haplosporangium sp. Z 767]|nr:hypothetical protein BGZ50_005455 [Haplosporangium sp. Z 11]KAF9185599.1 hypothetical protein BGZ51_002536 [Haplosporangium sp. Z 767]
MAMNQLKGPLHLPEIRILVVQLIDKKDLTSCVLVSKAWYKTFCPHLWKTITLSEHRHLPFKNAPAFPFCQIGHYVQKVVIDYYSSRLSWREMPLFPNLRSLTASCGYDRDDELILLLLHRNPTITHIDLKVPWYICKFSTDIWTLLSEYAPLVDLAVDGRRISCTPNPDAFFATCSRLQSLCLRQVNACDLQTLGHIPFLSIRKLGLYDSYGQQDNFLRLITKCPHLESLHWVRYSGFRSDFWPTFSALVASGAWPKLDALHIPNATIADEDLATVLTSMLQVAELDASGTAFGERAFVALRPYIKTIMKLNLNNCDGVTPAMATEIRRSSPNMRK